MPAREALIVAVARYEDAKLRRLRAPATDAERLREVLGDAAVGGFEVTVESDPAEGHLRRRLARFFSDRAPDDLLLLHVSCHGVKDDRGDLYLAASDTDSDPDLLSATAISAGWLNEQLERCRSKRIVVLLDCCFSGSFRLGMQPRAGDSVDVGGHLGGRGRAVITASNSMEYAFDGDRLSGVGDPSIFTGAVVDALATGRADRDGDGRISIDELYDYVYDHVRERTPGQTPTKLSTLEGPLFIARSSYRAPVQPATLDPAIVEALASHLAGIRLGAVEELAGLLGSPDPAAALAARQALRGMADDDSRAVSARVAQALASVVPERPPSEAPPPDSTAAHATRPRPSDAPAPAAELRAARRRRAPDIVVAVCAVALVLMADGDHGAGEPAVVGFAAIAALALSALRAFRTRAGRWRAAAGIAIVVCGLIAEIGALEGPDVTAQQFALFGAAIGVVLGGWVGLGLHVLAPRSRPLLGEYAAAAGAVAVFGSLWLSWSEGADAWQLSHAAALVALLSVFVVATVALPRAGSRVAQSAVGILVAEPIGAALLIMIVHFSDGILPPTGGRDIAIVGAVAVVSGGVLARVQTRRSR